MNDLHRDSRFSSTARGTAIAVGIAAYGYFFRQPSPSLTYLFLIGAGVQLAVICLRRFVAPEFMPQAMYIFELLADGVTVLMFALGVFSGILRAPPEL